MQVFGKEVYINSVLPTYGTQNSTKVNLYIDCETNETTDSNSFVGIGYTFDGTTAYYRTVLDEEFKTFLSNVNLIGHNLKFDAHMLKKWGVPIRSEQLVDDTMLMSFCMHGSSRSHALKALAGELLGLKWSSYVDMTTKVTQTVTYKKTKLVEGEDGSRKRVTLETPEEVVKVKKEKFTLDQLPVEQVAEYCCADVLATYQLHEYFKKQMDLPAKKLYQDIELPTLQVLFDMEERGINVDVNLLKQLDSKISTRIDEILAECDTFAPGVNIGSSKQLAPILEGMGYWLPTTSKGNQSVKKSVLEMYKGDPFIDLLLEYSELKKLSTSFTQPLSQIPSLPRVHPTFNQVRSYDEDQLGISTGRLSCADPNLQQIPRKSELAKEIRKLFIPDEGKVLVVADFSQIEPRILAHMTNDFYLQDVFRESKDLYKALIKGTKWEARPDGRDIGKTFYLALSYGAQAKKLAKVFKCSVEEAQGMLNQCWENIPQVKEWQVKTIEKARQCGYVETMFGRKRFIPELASKEFYERASAERKATNTPIQGTAADVMKLAMIALHKAGYPIQLVVHDEVIVSVEPDYVDLALDDIKNIMETIVQLDVPLKAEIKAGGNWHAAKS